MPFRNSYLDERRFMFDPFAHAVTTIEEEHRLTHDGMVFAVQTNELGIPDGEVRQVLYRPQTKPVHLKRFSINASEGPIILTVYEDPNYDDPGSAALSEPLNLNRMSPNVAEMLITRSPLLGGLPIDGADRGNPVLGALYIPAAGNNGVSGSTIAIEEIVLAIAGMNSGYLIEFKNDPLGAGTADVYAAAVFYELSYNP